MLSEPDITRNNNNLIMCRTVHVEEQMQVATYMTYIVIERSNIANSSFNQEFSEILTRDTPKLNDLSIFIDWLSEI